MAVESPIKSVELWACHCGQLIASDEPGRQPDIACPACECPADWTLAGKGLLIPETVIKQVNPNLN